MAEKIPGRSKKNSNTKKSIKAPIPIDSGVAPAQPVSATMETQQGAHPAFEEEIRIRAYEIYEERGRQDGFQDEDWSRAEIEVLARHRDKTA